MFDGDNSASVECRLLSPPLRPTASAVLAQAGYHRTRTRQTDERRHWRAGQPASMYVDP